MYSVSTLTSPTLPQGDVEETELSGHRGTHRKIVDATGRTGQLSHGSLSVGFHHFPLEERAYGIVPETLQLQFRLSALVVVVLLQHLQFRLALDAHPALLAALLEGLFKRGHLVGGLQRLLTEREGALLHLYLLLAVVSLLVFPFCLLLVDGAEQFGIGEHQDGVAHLEHGTVLGHNALHVAVFLRIEPYGLDGAHEAFHINVFHEGGFGHIDNLVFLGINLQLARAQRKNDGIDGKGQKGKACEEVIEVLSVPGSGFELDVHNHVYDWLCGS